MKKILLFKNIVFEEKDSSSMRGNTICNLYLRENDEKLGTLIALYDECCQYVYLICHDHVEYVKWGENMNENEIQERELILTWMKDKPKSKIYSSKSVKDFSREEVGLYSVGSTREPVWYDFYLSLNVTDSDIKSIRKHNIDLGKIE
jgi:hypothetical protein